MLGSHETVAIRPPSKAVRHREGCEEAILKARVSGWNAAQVAVRCLCLMGRRGAIWGVERRAGSLGASSSCRIWLRWSALINRSSDRSGQWRIGGHCAS